jgi:hypothetical protein
MPEGRSAEPSYSDSVGVENEPVHYFSIQPASPIIEIRVRRAGIDSVRNDIWEGNLQLSEHNKVTGT